VNSVQEQITRKRLQWVEHARQGILSAIGDVVSPNFRVIPSVDPLKFILRIKLNRPLQKRTRSPLRTYIRCWAKEFECDVPIININDHHIQAEILTRQRKWTRDQKGKFYRGAARFTRRVG